MMNGELKDLVAAVLGCLLCMRECVFLDISYRLDIKKWQVRKDEDKSCVQQFQKKSSKNLKTI